jgi:hypothetical protein
MNRLSVLAAIGILGCQSHYTKISPNDLPAFLQPLPGATEVLATRQEDSTTWIHFTLDQQYPASDALHGISQRLEQAGWQKLPDDFLNPSIPSSHGWGEYGDSTVSPPARVHQWMADWRNEAGDIVRYELRYTSPTKLGAGPLTAPENSHLRVVGALIPAPVASALVSAARTPLPDAGPSSTH